MATIKKEIFAPSVASQAIQAKLKTISAEVKDFYSTRKERDAAESKKDYERRRIKTGGYYHN